MQDSPIEELIERKNAIFKGIVALTDPCASKEAADEACQRALDMETEHRKRMAMPIGEISFKEFREKLALAALGTCGMWSPSAFYFLEGILRIEIDPDATVDVRGEDPNKYGGIFHRHLFDALTMSGVMIRSKDFTLQFSTPQRRLGSHEGWEYLPRVGSQVPAGCGTTGRHPERRDCT